MRYSLGIPEFDIQVQGILRSLMHAKLVTRMLIVEYRSVGF